MIGTVDSAALLELVWAAPLAALVVTISWGMVVYGTARAGEARRDGRTGPRRCTSAWRRSAARSSSPRSSSG